MSKWVLVKAIDGIIGPAATYPPETTSYNTFEEAVKEMVQDIEAEGGGDCDENFGYGTSDNGFAYEIFGA